MNLNNFRLVKEDANTYHVAHPNGNTLQVSKTGLSEKAHAMIKGLRAQHFDDGGQEAAVDDSRAPASDDAASVPFGMSPSDVPAPQPVVQPTPAPSNTGGASGSWDDSSAPQAVQPAAGSDVPTYSMPDVTVSAKKNAKPAPNPYEQEKAANTAGAKAVQKQGEAESKAIDAVQQKIDAMPTQVDIVNGNKAKNDQLMQAYMDKKVDPNRYMHDLSTGGKIAAGIALFLGGMSTPFTHQGNPALEVINNAIGRDIDAQKNSQDQQMNLWKMNREALGSDLAANLATQNQMYTGLKYKLLQAASQFKGPQAMAQAQAANALIDQKMAMNNQLLGLHAGLAGEAGDGTEQNFAQNLSKANMFAPEMAKEAQAKYVPGVGIARIPLTADDRSALTNYDSVGKTLDKAIDFQENIGGNMGVWTPTHRADAASLKNELNVSLGQLYGLKRLNDREYQNYKDQIDNIGGVNS